MSDARDSGSQRYDVAVVGAGPTGSVCALAFARKGARVALFESSLNGRSRLAGEWLHPPALRMLQELRIDFDVPAQAALTDGFMVYPEDGSAPIVLPYPDGSHGIALEHEVLVSRLREAAVVEPNIELIQGRVRAVDDGWVTFTRAGVEERVIAGLIVGADGQRLVVRRSLGLTEKPTTCSRMLGFELTGVPLPVEGYGSVICGAPGPIFVYRLREGCVRVNVDIPLKFPPDKTTDLLLDSYVHLLPEELRPAFADLARERRFDSTANTLSPRISYGSSDRMLIGDAAGHYHPMTAVGITLGLGDAMAGAESERFGEFANGRFWEIRAPEMLALAFFEVMVDQRAESVALRKSIYRMWRRDRAKAEQSMRLLGCEDTSEASLGYVSGVTVVRAITEMVPRSTDLGEWRRAAVVLCALLVRVSWFVRGVWRLNRARKRGDLTKKDFLDAMARALPTSLITSDRANRRRD